MHTSSVYLAEHSDAAPGKSTAERTQDKNADTSAALTMVLWAQSDRDFWNRALED